MLTETQRLAIVRSIAGRCIATERMNAWAFNTSAARRARFTRDLAQIAVLGVTISEADMDAARDVALSVAVNTIAAVDGLVLAQNAAGAGDAEAAERAVGIRLGLAELATAGLR